MQKTTDHSYESIQSALQMAVDKLKSVPEIAKEHGMGERTLYTYIQRMCTGQTIRGVHSRRGTSAIFSVNEHGQVEFEVTPNAENRKKSVTTGTFMERLEKIDEKLSTIIESIERLEKQLKTLQME
ncbi:TPA: hypothetical protein ACPD3C_002021 [Pasteurella multocida]